MWLEIGKTIIELFQKNEAKKIANRKRLSEIFGEIGDVLMDTAQQMDRDIYPHGNCQVLRSLSSSFFTVLMPLLPLEELTHFHNKLMEASDIELQFPTRKDKGVIPNIYEAAGMFKAASILYK